MPSNNKSFILSAKAKLGDANAQFELGLMYYNGEDIDKDIEKAIFWLEKAGSSNNINAMYYLGLINEFEKKQYLKASQFYEKAATKGHTEAQRALAYMYLSGSGIKSDTKKALFWFTLAAEGNNAEAQFYLGEFNCFGHGIPVNIEKAIYWYKLAAENNYKQAINRLKEFPANRAEYVNQTGKLENESFFFKLILNSVKGESFTSKDIPLYEFLITVCQGLSFNMRAHLSYTQSSGGSISSFFLQGAAYMFSKAVEAAMFINHSEDFTFDFKKIINPEYGSRVLEYIEIIEQAQETGKDIVMTIVREAEASGIKTLTENSLWTDDTISDINLRHEEKVMIKWIPLLGLAYAKRKGYLGVIDDKSQANLEDINFKAELDLGLEAQEQQSMIDK